MRRLGLLCTTQAITRSSGESRVRTPVVHNTAANSHLTTQMNVYVEDIQTHKSCYYPQDKNGFSAKGTRREGRWALVLLLPTGFGNTETTGRLKAKKSILF